MLTLFPYLCGFIVIYANWFYVRYMAETVCYHSVLHFQFELASSLFKQLRLIHIILIIIYKYTLYQENI